MAESLSKGVTGVPNGNSKGWIGHVACFTAYLIFGLNIVVCKNLTQSGIFSPLALFTFRALGASVLFWIISMFTPREKVDAKDFPKIFVASMLGLFLTQVSFLFGIRMVTPLDWAILSVLSPIFTMFTAAIVVKEPITWKKAGGVAISFIGITVLILSSSHSGGAATTSVWGVLLGLLNAGSFALYLGIFRPLIKKYSVVTFMKWMFLFSLAVSFPFSCSELLAADYSVVTGRYLYELLFLIIFSTVIAYYLIPLGQKYIRPTAVSLYSYLQPIIASMISIYLGMDRLTVLKVAAAVAVVAGVVLVNKSRAASS
ncbi:MAG: EamA family transporter [Bacteroidales bacterium]|nr:EamA family transporter [Bacteroidales bacterium]